MWWSGLRSRSRRGEGTLDVVDKVASADLVDGMGKRSPHEATCPRIASGFSEKDAACLPFTQRYSEKFSGLALQVWRFVVLCRATIVCLLHFGPASPPNHRQSRGRTAMTYVVKPLSCDPSRIRGMSERMINSDYENNYGGAVKRLNLIEEKNGLKREQLVATSSKILHEVFFDSLGNESEAGSKFEGCARAGFRLLRSLASRIHCRGQSPRRRRRLGAADLVATRSKAHQSMGRRSLPHNGWWHAHSGARYVRAFLSHRLRRQGREIRGRLCGGDQLASGAAGL
jgi:hypothetical protein